MSKTKSALEPIAPFSTTLRQSTKELLERFSKKRGAKINHIVEQALLEFIEDEMDKEVIDARELEETITWKKHA